MVWTHLLPNYLGYHQTNIVWICFFWMISRECYLISPYQFARRLSHNVLCSDHGCFYLQINWSLGKLFTLQEIKTLTPTTFQKSRNKHVLSWILIRKTIDNKCFSFISLTTYSVLPSSSTISISTQVWFACTVPTV
jgi:hypothetical protein